MFFKLYVANPYDEYEKQIKPYRGILKKYKLEEAKEHNIKIEDGSTTFVGTIKIDTLEELLNLQKDLIVYSDEGSNKGSIPIILEDNKLVLYTDYLE